MSSFSGLNVGLSSLFAQRRGLELTGHNVANANTEGYSRQRVQLQGAGGPTTPALHSRWTGAGNGVTIAGDERLRDAFLEGQSLRERGKDTQLRTQQTTLSRLEGVFGEPSDSGLASQLSDFWSGFDAVAKNPTDRAARSQLLERAATLANGLNDTLSRMDAQVSGSLEKLGVVVSDVNATAETVASLNRAIVSGTRAERNVNDLKDQRDLLVQRLASLTGATVEQGDAGSVDVVLDGRPLVSGRTANALEVGSGAAPSVVWSDDGAEAATGGEAGGLLHSLNTVVPRYREGLAQVATRLADVVNAQHSAGYDRSGASPTTDFFVKQPDGRLVVGIHDPDRVAASSTGTAGGDAGGGNALVLARQGSLDGGPDQAYRALVVTLGVEAQTANRSVDIQAAILGQVDAARESDAGVNLDEEMTNMLAYQRAYEGAARFLTSVDQMLDTLINRTGLVGR